MPSLETDADGSATTTWSTPSGTIRKGMPVLAADNTRLGVVCDVEGELIHIRDDDTGDTRAFVTTSTSGRRKRGQRPALGPRRCDLRPWRYALRRAQRHANRSSQTQEHRPHRSVQAVSSMQVRRSRQAVRSLPEPARAKLARGTVAPHLNIQPHSGDREKHQRQTGKDGNYRTNRSEGLARVQMVQCAHHRSDT